MTAWANVERQLMERTGISRRPVAVAFRESAPAGVAKFEGAQPSGCSFWRLAGEGRAFYTVPADHHNCPIGSYTHGIDLPSARAGELEQTLGLMANIGYVRMEEVPGIPRLPRAPGVVVYAPLAGTPVDPDVVIVAGRPGRVMLLLEAAGRAGVAAPSSLLGRPTCMALPAALGGGAFASTGCIGNRVYTDLGDDELYVMIAGRDLPRVAEALEAIASANETLAGYHRGRRQTLSRIVSVVVMLTALILPGAASAGAAFVFRGSSGGSKVTIAGFAVGGIPFPSSEPYPGGWYEDPATLIVDVAPHTAQVLLDGRPLGTAGELVAQAVPVALGSHVLQVQAPGYRTRAWEFYADGSFPVRVRAILTLE